MTGWLAAVILLVVIASPAAAEWTNAQRTQFIGSCVKGCQPTSSRPEACPKACGCLADEGEKIMTPADYEAAVKASKEGKNTAKTQELDTHRQACIQQTIGK